MAATPRFTALVLAGSRRGEADAVARYCRVRHKSLAPAAGRPMLCTGRRGAAGSPWHRAGAGLRREPDAARFLGPRRDLRRGARLARRECRRGPGGAAWRHPDPRHHGRPSAPDGHHGRGLLRQCRQPRCRPRGRRGQRRHHPRELSPVGPNLLAVSRRWLFGCQPVRAPDPSSARRHHLLAAGRSRSQAPLAGGAHPSASAIWHAISCGARPWRKLWSGSRNAWACASGR